MSGGGEGLGVPVCTTKMYFFFHLALAENIYVGSKKIIVAYGTNHTPNGINLFRFPFASAVPMPPSRPLGIVLDSKFLGARSLPLMLGSGKERGAKCHALVLLLTTPAAFSIHCRVE